MPDRAPEPDGGHPDRAPGEAGALEVPPRRPDRRGRRPRRGRADRESTAAVRGHPGAGHRRSHRWSRSTANSCRCSSPTHALTRAWSSPPPSEHQGLRPSRTYADPRRHRPQRLPRPLGGEHAPGPGRRGSSPAWPRMASASRCGSSTRATVRSAAPTPARADHRCAVRPAPGPAAGPRLAGEAERGRHVARGRRACPHSSASSRRCSPGSARPRRARRRTLGPVAWSCVICPPGLARPLPARGAARRAGGYERARPLRDLPRAGGRAGLAGGGSGGTPALVEEGRSPVTKPVQEGWPRTVHRHGCCRCSPVESNT